MAPKHRSPPSSEDSSSDDEPAGAAIPNHKKPGANPPPKAPTPAMKRADPDDGEEEEDEESEDDEVSDSDAERSRNPPPSKSKPQIQQKPQPKPVPAPSKPAPSKPASKPAEPDSDEDESSEEEGDADEPPTTQRGAQTNSSDVLKPKKPPSATATATATATTTRVEPQKRQKMPSSDPSLGPKRQLFHRLWGPDDIITTLRGLMDYRTKKGILPVSSQDFEVFHAFVRGSLGIEVNKNQMSKKVREIKKKFESAIARRDNGADPTFTKPHDQEVFELSKKIWGAQNNGVVKSAVDSDGSEGDDSNGEVATKPRVRTAPSPTIVNGNCRPEEGKSSYSYFEEAVDVLVREHPHGPTLKRAYDLLDDSKARDLDEKFKKQRRAEIKQHFRRMDLMKEAAKVLFDALG